MPLSAEDRLFAAVKRNDTDAAEAVRQAIRDGANVNAVRRDTFNGGFYKDTTPLVQACIHGSDQIIRILLDAGADAGWKDNYGWWALTIACNNGHLSTVQLLINHDNGLLEFEDNFMRKPLIVAIRLRNSDLVRLLLDRGADANCVVHKGITALMHSCQEGSNLEIVRLLLAAGADVEARDKKQQTALHYAARRGDIEVVRELVIQHNANMCAVDGDGRTPFDLACRSRRSHAAVNPLLEMYGKKLIQDHGRLALHELLKVAQYSFAEGKGFHPPLNPLQIVLPLGKLTLKRLRTLLRNLDPKLIRNRDDTGKLPIHIACQTGAPVEVLSLILELDPAVLHIADSTGALPIHLLCGTATAAAEYASVRYLVEQGGAGTLAARDRQGLLPLHLLCGSTNPPLRAVQYLIHSFFPGSVAVQTNAGEYPFMVAACEISSASLSVVYEIVRVSSNLVVPR